MSEESILLQSNMNMEEMLLDAAFRGDVVALTDLLDQDPNLLEKHYLKCEDRNVLHVAAMLGKVAFFQAVLLENSPFRQDLCLARDRDGKNPIHLAASHGNLIILELIKDQSWLLQAALEKTDKGGTILHLCVKHNQLDAFKILKRIFTDPDFQKAKNEDGMTILHLAWYYNQNQARRAVIIFLIKNVASIVNVKNANGKTALDLFLRDAGIGMDIHFGMNKKMHRYDSEMTNSLLGAKALQGRDIAGPDESAFDKRRDAIMVVASLIATMAFQAMINPPGGVWQDNLLEGVNPHRMGESVMAQTHPTYYKHLIKASTVAFVSSLSIIILLIRGMSIRPLYFFALSSIVMWLSVAAIAVVYGISLVTIVPESVRGSNLSASSYIAVITIMVWSLIVIAIIVGRLRRGSSIRKSITPTLPLNSPFGMLESIE